ncbi:MAG: GNAT family N-acetyltransferase [Defluviitaleaceae bacterium]|nr:GNAT family N-acetyltransferase [Defluviitaleaceae bacterium]
MEVEIFLAPIEKRHVLQNMIGLYLYDMSEIDNELELNDDGLYDNPWLDSYWKEAERHPYLLTAGGKYVGFVLVREIRPNVFSVAEFFIMRKYRKLGLGSVLMSKMFEFHKGKWEISTLASNTSSQHFWRKIIKNTSHGEYQEYSIYNGKRIEWSFCN